MVNRGVQDTIGLEDSWSLRRPGWALMPLGLTLSGFVAGTVLGAGLLLLGGVLPVWLMLGTAGMVTGTLALGMLIEVPGHNGLARLAGTTLQLGYALLFIGFLAALFHAGIGATVLAEISAVAGIGSLLATLETGAGDGLWQRLGLIWVLAMAIFSALVPIALGAFRLVAMRRGEPFEISSDF